MYIFGKEKNFKKNFYVSINYVMCTVVRSLNFKVVKIIIIIIDCEKTRKMHKKVYGIAKNGNQNEVMTMMHVTRNS